ncbi:hypothetical protein EX84_15340, partial [Staphylococcus aureus]
AETGRQQLVAQGHAHRRDLRTGGAAADITRLPVAATGRGSAAGVPRARRPFTQGALSARAYGGRPRNIVQSKPWNRLPRTLR